MDKSEKASVGLVKILVISIILVFVTGIGVMASTSAKLLNVKVVLSNGYEMSVITSKTNVAEILDEGNITLEENEFVYPDLDEDISQNRTIRITNNPNEILVAGEIEEIITREEILSSYGTITEKLITEQITIPFETIIKEATGANGTKQNRIVQNGQNGLKEVVYKVKYQGEEEIEKIEISSTIIKEPVNHIVEVKTVQVTSRSSSERVSGTVAEYQAYAKEQCLAYGWSESDFECLVKLWNRESNWRVTAKNKSSGAYGIPQSLPANKMASAGSDYLTNYKTQINWGLGYIKSRYGTPTQAWAHSQATGWY